MSVLKRNRKASQFEVWAKKAVEVSTAFVQKMQETAEVVGGDVDG